MGKFFDNSYGKPYPTKHPKIGRGGVRGYGGRATEGGGSCRGIDTPMYILYY